MYKVHTKGEILKNEFRSEEVFDTRNACFPALHNVDVSKVAEITLIQPSRLDTG